MVRDAKLQSTQESQLLRERIKELEQQLAAAQRQNASRPLRAPSARSVVSLRAARQLADAQLRATAERLAGVGSWSWDPRTGHFDGSAEFRRIVGLPAVEDRDAIQFDEFLAAAHPEDRSLLFELVHGALRSRVQEQVELRLVLSERELREVTVVAMAVSASSGDRSVMGVVIDATERLESGRAMQHALDHLNDAQCLAQVGSWLVDLDTGASEWTPETYRILGLGLDEVPSNERLVSCIHPEDRAHLRALETRALLGEMVEPSEVRVLWPDGSQRQVVVAVRLEREPSGRSQYWGTLMDVTQHRSLEQQLLQAQKMEALGRLSGSIAHDFNNLLTVILLNTSMLRVHFPDLRELAQVEEAASQAASVTSQLLAFSRRSIRRLRPVDVSSLVRDALSWLERIVGEQIHMEFVPTSAPAVVSSDEAQLRQVLLNLVVNARDAMPAGGVLRVAVELVEPGQLPVRGAQVGGEGYVCIRVTDNGVGMDAATRARAFEPFFSTKQPGQGSGLGLSTVFGIVNQHDGFVDVQSAPGLGAEFRVFLPQTLEGPCEIAKLRSPKLPSGRETLLLVEDERLVRMTMEALLAEAGYDVLVAEDPAQALTIWAEHAARISLLVTDMVMPGMSGGQLARRLRQDRSQLPVLFVTGYDPRAESVAMEHAWCITKPFDPARLLESVRVALDAHLQSDGLSSSKKITG